MAMTIVHKGIKLAYEDRGAGKPAFVFVHGWTCDRSFFAPQAEHFARRHSTYAGTAKATSPRGHIPSQQPRTISRT
jgi:pimeloyl-ACP methyl ester carboxylesterase